MKLHLAVIIVLLLALSGLAFIIAPNVFYRNSGISKPTATTGKKAIVINILPLGNVDQEYISLISSAIKKFYGFNSTVLPEAKFTSDILAASKTRYDASRILKKYNCQGRWTLIITESDIAWEDKERGIKEWGIFGLGNLKGTTCVVSCYRLNGSTQKPAKHELFIERLQKIALHELGHNLGIKHCTSDSKCLMSAANGKISQVDQQDGRFCKNCMKAINSRPKANLMLL